MPEKHGWEYGGVRGAKWKWMYIRGVGVLKQALQATLCKQQQEGSVEI